MSSNLILGNLRKTGHHLTTVRLLKSLQDGKHILSSVSMVGVRNYADKSKSKEPEESAMQRGLSEINQNIYGSLRRPKAKPLDESRNRNVPVPWELSVKYMTSRTYQETYQGYKVWELYRRQHKGPQMFPPQMTRKTCIGEDGYVKGSSPCALCRDKYLVPHYRNVLLLQQFIAPWSGQVLESRKTNLCQMKHEEVLVAIYQAKNYGTINFMMPTRMYDYREYYLPEQLTELELDSELETLEDPALEAVKQIPEFGDHYKYSMISYPRLPPR